MEVTLVANDVGGLGGMEQQLAELVEGLVHAGDDVTVIARTCDVRVPVAFHRVRGPARPFAIAYPWFLLAASLVLGRHRRGIVQATGAIVLNRVDVTAIHFCHRGSARRSPADRGGRSTLPFRAHASVARLLARAGERVCLRPSRIRRLLAVSPGAGAEIARCYPALADRITVIGNGVDRNRFRPASPNERAAARAKFGLPDDERCAVFVGGDWGRKGLTHAIESLVAAADWHLAVAGKGDDTAYRQLARNFGVVDRVHMLGVIRDTPTLYHAADAFVLPSAYETFSLVAYEAAASGLPLVATTVSGIEDVLIDGVTGFRVAPDGVDIARRLRELAAAPERAAAMGAAARERTARYAWGAMVARHKDLYGELDHGRSRAPVEDVPGQPVNSVRRLDDTSQMERAAVSAGSRDAVRRRRVRS